MVYTFIGKAHFPDDPRLYHRIASELKKRQTKINWIDFHNRPSSDDDITYHHPKNLTEILHLLRTIPSDVIQISDPREWLYGIATRVLSNAKLVYDSHEDYYGQHTIKWHQTKNPIFFFSRYVLWFLNLFCAGISHITWSTDEYGTMHLNKVQKNTHFLPNYVSKTSLEQPKINFRDTDLNAIRFLYVGSYNSERGLSEFLNYLNDFNRKYSTTHKLTIFGFADKFPKMFKESEYCIFKDYLPMDALYAEMCNYDIGVCLWLDNKKHRRNIPIKIMEYLATGLPVIVSNFGYMKKYAVEWNAGLGIDPLSFAEFEEAIQHLSNKERLKTFSDNGLRFTDKHYFEGVFKHAFNTIYFDK